jgi:hypothetical protein
MGSIRLFISRIRRGWKSKTSSSKRCLGVSQDRHCSLACVSCNYREKLGYVSEFSAAVYSGTATTERRLIICRTELNHAKRTSSSQKATRWPPLPRSSVSIYRSASASDALLSRRTLIPAGGFHVFLITPKTSPPTFDNVNQLHEAEEGVYLTPKRGGVVGLPLGIFYSWSPCHPSLPVTHDI